MTKHKEYRDNHKEEAKEYHKGYMDLEKSKKRNLNKARNNIMKRNKFNILGKAKQHLRECEVRNCPKERWQRHNKPRKNVNNVEKER